MQTINLINKIITLQEIVQNVIRSNQLYKTLGFLEAIDLNSCVIYSENIFLKLKLEYLLVDEQIKTSNFNNIEQNITTLQAIIGEISTLISLYGCDTLENLIQICIGHKFSIEAKYQAKYDLLKAYVKPVRYKILDWRAKLKSNDEAICKKADNFECFDFGNESVEANFHYQTSGIKFAIHNVEKQHTLIVYGIIEDVMLEFMENPFLTKILTEELLDETDIFKEKSYERFIKCLTLKEILIYSPKKLQNKYLSYVEQFAALNKKSLAQIIQEFLEKTLCEKRNILIMLLLNSDENECHYLAYLLYDLLSNDINGIIDTYEQTLIYDSLPYNVKKYFRDVMKQIVTYTNRLSNANISKISLEQRICLMKTNDIVKEKAMVKLREIKMKTEDTGSKATQFLEGLLKIPFEVYKEEPVLKLMRESLKQFSIMVKGSNADMLPFPAKNEYTSLEIQTYLPLLKGDYEQQQEEFLLSQIQKSIATFNKPRILEIGGKLKNILQEAKITVVLKTTGKNINQLREEFLICLTESLKIKEIKMIIYEFMETLLPMTQTIPINEFNAKLIQIEDNIVKVNTFMGTVTNTLDKSVYGHKNAKRQIERIIGQWINGDMTGYCFGFEGPPGVGKTSLAKKGIAQCLMDEEGVARPFAFIAMGGSTNSSTLDGHNYTYVGSTWGRIVDILMDTKIMNPIIFIDELDKVSKTENGKEIIGILTHLIDQTQNDSFQDKYFNGINLNLSKALFIFSYNDVELIDKILLDRIHRIKFDTICVEDKLIIMRNFILPEIYKKMGLENMLDISDAVIEYIINDYTSEPGVRKLKELMFEIVGEINLDILKNNKTHGTVIPIMITIDDIKMKYLKDHTEIRPMKIHNEPLVGVINGMWANSVGKGGILPIEAAYYPSTTFLDLKLTGMQGEVMKESMTVAKSLAWSLYLKDTDSAQLLTGNLEKNKNQGIHIHVPEGATPKDGPSAGTAITMVLFSLFSGKKIKNDVAITGEICLQGRVTAIGGLELKILGGIRAGVKTFIYPQENEKEFIKFMKKYENKSSLNNIRFIAVDRIEEVIPLIFV
jgi:ATP-dependent Lon protease